MQPRGGQFAGVKLTPPDKGRIAVVDPLLTSLAAAFKTAFERLSGSKRIWADARSVIFHFRPIIVAAVSWLS